MKPPVAARHTVGQRSNDHFADQKASDPGGSDGQF